MYGGFSSTQACAAFIVLDPLLTVKAIQLESLTTSNLDGKCTSGDSLNIQADALRFK